MKYKNICKEGCYNNNIINYNNVFDVCLVVSRLNELNKMYLGSNKIIQPSAYSAIYIYSMYNTI